MALFNYWLIFLFILTGFTKNIEGKKAGIEKAQKHSVNIPLVDDVWLKNKIKNRNGKILVINFWATWCEPCVEEFPDLVKIYNDNKYLINSSCYL